MQTVAVLIAAGEVLPEQIFIQAASQKFGFCSDCRPSFGRHDGWNVYSTVYYIKMMHIQTNDQLPIAAHFMKSARNGALGRFSPSIQWYVHGFWGDPRGTTLKGKLLVGY